MSEKDMMFLHEQLVAAASVRWRVLDS
jgi:hypothetical protein